jgi:molybdopterin-binding protein
MRAPSATDCWGLATPGRRRVTHPQRTLAFVALTSRNRLRGFVEELRIDGLMGQVRLRIGDQILTAVVTSDALRELDPGRGTTAGDQEIRLLRSPQT